MKKKLNTVFMFILFFQMVLSNANAQAASSTFLTYVNQINNWTTGNNIAAGMGVPGYAPSNNYNIFALSFFLTAGPAGPALVWDNPMAYIGPYTNLGTTNDQIRQSMIAAYHGAGKKVIVSAFGSTETPTTQGANPTTTCTNLANWALANNLDGIDVDYEDIQAMNAGTGEAWLISCTKAIRAVMPSGQFILIHSPVAPFFSGKNLYPGGGYVYINQQVGNLIDFYNVQFYNQGSTTYDTYSGLFTQSIGYFPSTALKEIIDKGIPASKVILGKPASTTDAVNTGYVVASDLASMIMAFRNSYPTYGWQAGASTWQYSSDMSGGFINVVTPSFNSAITVDTQNPTTPTGLVSTAVSSSQINLSWVASTDNIGVAGYYVYKNGTILVSTTALSYSNTGLTAGTAYTYTVAAFDAAGNVSAQSSSVTVSTQVAADTVPPAAINTLSASNLKQTSALLSWMAPGNNENTGTASSYDIRYSTKSITSSNFVRAKQAVGEPTPLIVGSAQSYTLPGLTAGRTYYVAMKTIDAAGNTSSISNVSTFKTPTTGPLADNSVPTALTGNPQSKQVAAIVLSELHEKSILSQLASMVASFFSRFFHLFWK